MQITILGSGTGTPSLTRNPSALAVKIAEQILVFDTGPGTIKRLLEIGITYQDIDYIFYTHFHTDHTLDLASFLFAAKYSLSLRTRPINIIGPCGLEKFYQGLLSIYGDVIRPEAYQLKLKEIGQESLEFSSYKIATRRLAHTPESIGYRIESDGRVLVYTGDTDLCANLVKLSENADVLITECSFPDQMKVPGHLTAQEAAQAASQANCKKLILTHLYPVCQEQEISQQARAQFKGEVVVARDLLQLTV